MCNLQFGFKPHSYVKVDKENLIKFSLKDSVKNYLNDNTLDIFEKLTVLAVEKCPRSLNLKKNPRNGKKEIFFPLLYVCRHNPLMQIIRFPNRLHNFKNSVGKSINGCRKNPDQPKPENPTATRPPE